jgi:CSLREA domain-containing protein
MAFYTASTGTTSYTGTADDDYFRFDTEFDAQNFDIGTTVDGGSGTDEVIFSFRSSYATTITVDLDAGFSVDGVTYVTFSSVENVDLLNTPATQSYTINGTSGANTLAGDSGNDTINGLGGNDILSGGEGTNVLNGGAGNDRLNGSYYTASTTMNGGTGDDTYSILVAGSDTVVELAGEGTDTVESRVSYTLGANVENLTLASGYNEYGPDTVLDIDATGNSLDNVIIGNSDANVITAGAGNDTLTGNGGGDTYVFASGDGANVITDFDHDLDTLDFSAFSASDQALLANPVSNGSGQSVYTAGAFSVSVPQLPVTPNTAPTGRVVITGTAVGDEILTADTSAIADADGLGTFRYTWLRNGVALEGVEETGLSTYQLIPSDVGEEISVRVTYTDDGGTEESLTSAAVEVEQNVFVVTTFDDVVDDSDGVTSLREAVNQANAVGDEAIVELGAGTYNVFRPSSLISINGNVIIRGQGAENTTIENAMANTRVFNVNRDAVLGLEDLTLDGARSSELITSTGGNIQGGAILVAHHGTLNIQDSHIENHQTSIREHVGSGLGPAPKAELADYDYYVGGRGGAIFNDNGVVNISGSEFSGNKAHAGGAIFNDFGRLNIDSSNFSDNSTFNIVHLHYVEVAGIKGGYPPETGWFEKDGLGVDIFSMSAYEGHEITTPMEGYPEGEGYYNYEYFYTYQEPNVSVNDTTTTHTLGQADAYIAGDYPGFDAPVPIVEREDRYTREGETNRSALSSSMATPDIGRLQSNAAPDRAILDVVRRTDMSLDDLGDSDSAFALVEDGILSEGGRKIVVQLGDRRIVLQGQGLSLDGDPYDMTTEELLTAASGTITKITLQSANGNRVLSTMTGLDLAFEDLVISLTEIDYDNPPSIGDLLGVRLRVTGTGRNDVLEGTEANDRIDGEGGNDRLFGNGGKDVLLGGAGRDTLDAGTGGGKDILDGGGGADRMVGRDGKTIYIVDNEGDIVKEYGSEGNDEVRASISYRLGNDDVTGVDNIENLRLLGREDLNGTGNDLDNVITGNKGGNRLNGGDGDDKIIGGKGDDMLIGGQGRDTFVFSNGSGQDTIRDFNATDNQEQINLKKVASITSFNDLRNNHMEQQGDDVLIDLGRGNTITLLNVDITDLGAGDFLF